MTSCSSKVQFSDPSCPKISIAKTKINVTDAENIRSCDMAAEAEVAQQCQIAWRLALAHKEPQAMSILNKLAIKYPRMSTIDLMIGQVEEYSGKNDEAVKYFQKSVKNCEFSSLRLFKLANSLMNSNRPKEALVYYNKLIERIPKFAPAHLGVAKALSQMHSNDKARINKELSIVLEIEPDNSEAKTMMAK